MKYLFVYVLGVVALSILTIMVMDLKSENMKIREQLEEKASISWVQDNQEAMGAIVGYLNVCIEVGLCPGVDELKMSTGEGNER